MDDMNKILEVLKLNIDTPLYLNYKDMGKTDVIKKSYWDFRKFKGGLIW